MTGNRRGLFRSLIRGEKMCIRDSGSITASTVYSKNQNALVGAATIDAPAVFAGHGLVVPGLGINDLKGLDLHGEIAVILAGGPPPIHGPLKAYYRTAAILWHALKAAGAVGLITIPEPRPSQEMCIRDR